jgi:hypothetical protein
MIIRTIVAYANRSRVSSLTRAGLDKLAACTDIRFDIILAQGSNIVRNRNAAINAERSFAVHQKLEGFDYLLCLDSDVAIDVGPVRQLLAHDRDIVGGAYQKRERPDLICSGRWFNGIPGLSSDELCARWSDTGLKRMDWLGGGFLLLKKGVLERMEYPWFRYEIVRYQHNGVPHQTVTSDDYGFAINAGRAGYPLWLDCSCRLEHMALKTAGVLPDLPAARKIAIIEAELDRLEEEIYRKALELQAAQRGRAGDAQAIARGIDALNGTKDSYIQELEKVRSMVVG